MREEPSGIRRNDPGVSARGELGREAGHDGVGRQTELLEELGARRVREEALRDAERGTGTSTPASRKANVTADPIPPFTRLSSTTATAPADRASSTRAGLTAHPARVDDTRGVALSRELLPHLDRHPGERPDAHDEDLDLLAPGLVQDVDAVHGSHGGHRVGHVALGETQDGRRVGHVERLAQQLLDLLAITGAARRRPGTIEVRVMSHIPLWEGPSLPVTPARSRMNVTPAWCSAQSMSTWSKARLRKVA